MSESLKFSSYIGVEEQKIFEYSDAYSMIAVWITELFPASP